MMYIDYKKILIFLLFFLSTEAFSEECVDTNPTLYGSCEAVLGFVWTGNSCVLVYGCDIGDDQELFYDTYEECDITCSNNVSLGDINNDSQINVIDIVQLVNIILNDGEYNVVADVNFDNLNNVIDIVNLVNIILTSSDNRDSWQIINEDIITPKCGICHYEGSFYSELSNLILTEDVAYQQLINRTPDNQSASENGLQLLSNQGGLLGLLLSYFWEKINISNEVHFYSEHPQYGEIMPLGGPFLNNGELDFIEDWIWAGAPEEGIVADPAILNDQSEYETPEFEAPNPPIMGFQYHIGPFDVYPDTEREFLYYFPQEADEYYINQVEFVMAPGTHHAIAYMFSDGYSGPAPTPYEIRDIHMDYLGNDVQQMIENIMTLQEHTFVFGTQMPFWNYTLPDGIALKVASDYGLDINPHYFNYTDETIQGEIYLNFHTVLPQDVQIEAGILQLNNNDIELPPNQETTITKIFSSNQIVNSLNIEPPNNDSQLNIFQLFSHAHQLMTQFDILILHPDGTEELIYTSLDYEHPPILEMDPPLTLNSDQAIIARTTWNNTTDNWVNFGLLSVNEMMIIFGLVYFD